MTDCGAAMRDKITKRSVESVEPGDADLFLWDRELPGSAAKSPRKAVELTFCSTVKGGRDRRVTIGRHGIDLTAEQARKEAMRLRGEVASGKDPAQERVREQMAGATVADLAECYMTEYATPHRSRQGSP